MGSWDYVLILGGSMQQQRRTLTHYLSWMRSLTLLLSMKFIIPFKTNFQDIIIYQSCQKTNTRPPLWQTRGTFVWVVMPFGVKNGPPTYQRVVTKTSCDCIDVFMKIILDDFIIFNDLLIHLEKIFKCFFKCKEFGISLNPNKCAFMVFS